MNRILRGAVLLVASGIALGCNTEPDEMIGGDPTEIVADPEVVFVALGDSQAVLLRLIDQQGASLAEPITVSGATGPISVSIDSLFRPLVGPNNTLIPNPENTEIRIFVKGVGLGAQALTVTAGGITKSLPVTVTPTQINVTLSNATPSIAEPVTVTPEAGLTFTASSQLVDGTGVPVAYTISVAPDGSSMTVLFLPEASGAGFNVTNIVPAYAPTLTVNLPATVAFATAATVGTGLTGTDAIATAPVMTPLAPGRTVGVVDVGTSYGFESQYVGAPASGRLYKLIVPDDATVDFTLTFPGGKDLSIALYDESGTLIEPIADNQGNDSGPFAPASPEEHLDYAIAAGTYFVEVAFFDYGPELLPEFFTLTIFQHE